MYKLIRYLVLLASVSLAMLIAVPVAVAAEEPHSDSRHGSHELSCHDAKKNVKELKDRLIRLLKDGKPDHHTTTTTSTSHSTTTTTSTHANSAFAAPEHDFHGKVEKLKHDLEKAIWAAHKACGGDDNEHCDSENHCDSDHHGKDHECDSEHSSCDSDHESDAESNDSDDEESDDSEDDTEGEFTQVSDVPAGSVDTGGGPA